MTLIAVPRFRRMNRKEIDELLARNHMGRMAYARGSHLDIEPVHYVYSSGWLYGRVPSERRLEMTNKAWWPITFAVDEIEDPLHWRSVVVHGGFYTLDPAGAQWERAAAATALSLFRTLLPEEFTEYEIAPSVLFRIGVQEVVGRAATVGIDSQESHRRSGQVESPCRPG